MWAEAQVIEKSGTVIRKTGESIQGTLWIPKTLFYDELNYILLQEGPKFVDSAGNRIDLNPKLIAEYSFVWDSIEIRMISCDSKLPKQWARNWPNVFLKLEQDGPMQMLLYCRKMTTYRVGYAPTAYGTTRAISTSQSVQYDYVLKREGEQPLVTTPNNFLRRMGEYFVDCPQLAEKIERGELEYGEFSGIADEYNESCAGDGAEMHD